MTSEDPQADPSDAPVAMAAAQFIRALRGADAIDRITRVEATLMAVEADGLFAAERTLTRLWPADAGAAPAHEVIWMRPSGEGASMKLAAFDASGKVLLRRCYPVVAQKAGAAGHE